MAKRNKSIEKESLVNRLAEAENLRQNAEILVTKKSMLTLSQQTEAEMLKLIHEMKVHQIELDMQNRELIQARFDEQDAIDLYDLAPIAYYTMSDKGMILRLNRSGVSLLGKEPQVLMNSFFAFFVNDESKAVFYQFLKKLFESKTNEKCELILATEDNLPKNIHLSGIAKEDTNECLISISDITIQKRNELRFARINDCFLKFGADSVFNINLLVALCGELMGGSFSFYNCLQANMLCTKGQWNAPSSFLTVNMSKGCICTDVISSPEDKTLIFRDLQNSSYAQTDPNVKLYQLKTYVGKAVKYGGVKIGSLAVVFQQDVIMDENDLHIMEIIASAIGVEEDRKHKEDALNEMHLMLASISETSSDIIYVKDVLGRYLLFNNQAAIMAGKLPEEVIGKDDFFIFPANEARIVMDGDKKVMESGQLMSYEEVVTTTKGTTTFLSTKGPIFTKEGKLSGLFGIARDITESKRSEERLQQSEEKFRLMIQNSNDSFVLINEFGEQFFISEEAQKATAYSIEELKGPIVNVIYPDDLEIVLQAWERVLLNKEEKVRVQYRHKHKFKGFIWYEAVVQNFLDHPALKAVVANVRDITLLKENELKLKESEEKYHFMFAHNPQPMWIFDLETFAFLEINQAAIHHYGYTSEEFISMTIKDICSPEDFLLFLKSIAASDIEDNTLKEFRHLKKNNEIIYVQLSWHSILLNGKNALHVLVNDITERKKAEEILLESEARLRNFLQEVQSVSIQGYASDGTVQYWNKASEVLYGYTEKEAIGRNLRELIIPSEMKKDFELALQQMAETGLAIPPSEMDLIRKDGSFVSVLSSHAIVQLAGHPQEFFCIDIDISERKLTETALKESNELLSTFMKYSPIYAFIKEVSSSESRVLRASENYKDMIGVPGSEMEGKTMYDLFPLEYAAKFTADDWSVVSSSKILKVDEELNARNYTTFKYPILLGNKKLLAGYTIDVTDYIKAEEALKLAKESYVDIFNSVSEAIYVMDETACFIDVNKGAEKMYLYSKEELIGQTPMSVAAPGLNNMDKILRLMQKVIETGKSCQFEFWAVRKNGEIFPKEVIVNKGKYFGKDVLIATARDISERKQAEEALFQEQLFSKALLDNIPCIFFLYSYPELKMLQWNKLHETLFGYEAAEMEGRYVMDWHVPEAEELVLKSTKLLMEKGQDSIETLLKTKDGRLIPFLLSGVNFKRDGKQYLMGVGTDISKQKKSELEIKLKNQELLKMLAEKDKFFSIISHDLRSPFNSFLGLTQIMAEELPGLTMEEIHKFALSMRNSATHLFRLLENLLEWAQIQQGLIPFCPDVFVLRQMLYESIEIMAETAKDKQIEISIDVNDSIQIVADCNMFQTIIRNLVSNAVKFTQIGGKIHISAKSISESLVEISISDTGIGMNKFIRDHLFCIDINTSRKGTNDETSTGLGLIICNDFIAKHGGELWVESEEGNGSTFKFTIQKGKPWK